MGSQKPAKPDANQVKAAQSFWDNFTLAGKYSVIGTAIVLVLMLIFLV